MALATALGVGAGLAGIGGLLQGVGANQRGAAVKRTAQDMRNLAEERRRTNRRSNAFYSERTGQLAPQYSEATQSLIDAFAAGAQPDVAQARTTLAQTPALPPQTSGLSQSGAFRDALASRSEQVAAMNQPRSEALAQALARQQAQLDAAAKQSRALDIFAGVGNQQQNISQQMALRQALDAARFGASEQDMADALLAAQFEGGTLNAVGGLLGAAAPAAAAYFAQPSTPAVPQGQFNPARQPMPSQMNTFPPVEDLPDG